MMNRRHFLGTLLGTTMVSWSGLSAEAAELNKDYVVLDKPLPNANGTVIKVYSYDCPFCFRYDTGVDPTLVPKLEALGLKFVPQHLETKGKYGRTASEFFALCQLKDEEAHRNLEDPASLFKKAKDAVYLAYHRKSERWTGGEPAFIATLSTATGISAEAFAKERQRADVQALVESWKPVYAVAKVQGIPAYVVNGKYLLLTRSITSIDSMVATIKELAAK